MPVNFTNIINVTSNIQQYLPYINNGLTFVSDNPQIVPRSKDGVIKVEENKPLIIEPTRYQISNRSVLKVIDTQFNFYNFPASANVQETDNIELNLDTDLQDLISVSLTIPIPTDSKNQPINLQRIDTTYPSFWYYDGEPSPFTSDGFSFGFKELQFTGGTQPYPNGYTITEEILDTLLTQNKTLRFKFATQYRSNELNSRVSINTKLTRYNQKNYNPLPTDITFNKQQNVTSGDNPYGMTIRGVTEDYPYLVVTYIVNLNDTKPGDVYKLSAVAGAETFILAQNVYWDIDVVDIPNPNDMIYENVYDINNDTLILTDNQVRVKKTASTNQEIQLIPA